jgi:hypothetical protein
MKLSEYMEQGIKHSGPARGTFFDVGPRTTWAHACPIGAACLAKGVFPVSSELNDFELQAAVDMFPELRDQVEFHLPAPYAGNTEKVPLSNLIIRLNDTYRFRRDVIMRIVKQLGY